MALSIHQYINGTNSELMDIYLRKLCHTIIGDALKRQRRDQYGFGDKSGSPEIVKRNLTDDLLVDSDTTHSKLVENYYGNFDREIEKTGAQGFGKVSDD